MRFSILTLDLALLAGPHDPDALEPLSRLIAENNISCVCLQGCTQHREAPSQADAHRIREDNAVTVVAAQLGRFGLKYDYVWEWSHSGGTDDESGSAVLTQLPIIGSARRFVSRSDDRNGPHSRLVVAARLGISPEVNIDVYSVDLSGGEKPPGVPVEQLLGFVGDSPRLFVPEPEPKPRRPGRPPRASQADKRPEPVRMVFLAGSFVDSPDGASDQSIRSAGYSNGSQGIPAVPATGPSAARSPLVDAIYLRPGLRPTDAERVFADDRRSGILLGFEV